MLTNKDYCNYDDCVALAELGITYCGLHFYVAGDKDILCNNILQPMTTRTAEVLNYVLAIPLYVAQKWLREVKKLFIEITISAFDQTYLWEIYNTENRNLMAGGYSSYDTYEEALLEGIKEAIELLKKE